MSGSGHKSSLVTCRRVGSRIPVTGFILTPCNKTPGRTVLRYSLGARKRPQMGKTECVEQLMGPEAGIASLTVSPTVVEEKPLTLAEFSPTLGDFSPTLHSSLLR